MVGTLVQLQLRLQWRTIRSNTGVLIATVLFGVFLLGGAVVLAAGLVALRAADRSLAGAVTTAGFGLMAAAWPLIALLASGSDQTLDPGRFALFPLRASRLMPGLLVASLVDRGTVPVVILVLAQVITWSTSVPLALISALFGVLALLSSLLLARCLTAMLSAMLHSRRFRDLATIILALFSIGIAIGFQFIGQLFSGEVLDALTRVGAIVGWTPFGWPWAAIWDAGVGNWGFFAVRGTLSIILVLLLWKGWQYYLDRALVSPLEAGGNAGKVADSGLVERMVPDTPAGALAARSLRYWRRDPRHLVQGVVALLVPVLMALPILLDPGDLGDGAGFDPAGDSMLLMYPVLGALLMGSLTVATELSYDGSALWMQMSAGLRGRDDRWGRLIAFFWVFVPASVLVTFGFVILTGQWQLTLPALLATLGALMVSAAVGTVTGAVWQTPQPPPGQNAFARSSGGGVAAMLSVLVGMAVAGTLSAPFLAGVLLVGSRGWVTWLLIPLTMLYAPALLWAAVLWGGRVLDGSWPEVLKRVTFETS